MSRGFQPPPAGMVFLVTSETRDESMDKMLFGLKDTWWQLVKRIQDASTAIFVNDMVTGNILGLFEAITPGSYNLDPTYNNGNPPQGSPLPAQVRVRIRQQFPPVPLEAFDHVSNFRVPNSPTVKPHLSRQQVEMILAVFKQHAAPTPHAEMPFPQASQSLAEPPPWAGGPLQSASMGRQWGQDLHHPQHPAVQRAGPSHEDPHTLLERRPAQLARGRATLGRGEREPHRAAGAPQWGQPGMPPARSLSGYGPPRVEDLPRYPREQEPLMQPMRAHDGRAEEYWARGLDRRSRPGYGGEYDDVGPARYSREEAGVHREQPAHGFERRRSRDRSRSRERLRSRSRSRSPRLGYRSYQEYERRSPRQRDPQYRRTLRRPRPDYPEREDHRRRAGSYDGGRYSHPRDDRYSREDDRYRREDAYAIKLRRREGSYDDRDRWRELPHTPKLLEIVDDGTFTTVFLADIPEGLTPDECVDALDRCGYSGAYNFFLFEETLGRKLGSVSLNMVSCADAQRMFCDINAIVNFWLPDSLAYTDAPLAARARWHKIQGLPALRRHYDKVAEELEGYPHQYAIPPHKPCFFKLIREGAGPVAEDLPQMFAGGLPLPPVLEVGLPLPPAPQGWYAGREGAGRGPVGRVVSPGRRNGARRGAEQGDGAAAGGKVTDERTVVVTLGQGEVLDRSKRPQAAVKGGANGQARKQQEERVRAKPASPCRKGPRMAAPAAKEEHPNTQTERKLPAAQMRPAKGQPVKKARLDHDADLQLRLNSALASGKPKAKPVGSLKQGKGPAPASQSRGFVAAPSAKGNIAAPPKAAAYGQGGTQEKGTAAPAPSAAKVVDGNVHLLVKSVAEGSKDGSAGLNVSKKPATGEAASERAATVSVPESNGSTAHMGESRGDIGRVQATLSSGKDKPAPAHSNGEVPSAGEQPNSAKVADPSERSEAPRAAVQADHALKRHTIHMEAAGLGKGDVSLAVKGSEQPGVKSVPIKEPAAPPKAAGVSHHQETTPKETGETAVAALVGVKPEQRLNSALPALQPKAAPLQSVKWKLASNSAPAGVGPTNVAGRVSPGGDSNSALGVASSTPVEGKAARDSTSTVAAKPGSRSSNHQGSRVFANVPEQAGGDSKGSNRVAAKVELAGPRGGKPDKRHARIVWDAQVAARNAETRVEGRTNGSRGRMGDGKPIAAEVRAPVQPVAVMEELGADFLALPD